MTSQMIIKLDSDLKKKVDIYAKTEGKTTSAVVRELLEEYVRDRDVSPYIKDLWDRIGSDLRLKGVTESKINSAIQKERSAD